MLLKYRFSESCIDIKDSQEQILFLPDLDERHVSEAAIEGQADLNISQNIKDFPKGRLFEFGLSVQTPENFVFEIYRKGPSLNT